MNDLPSLEALLRSANVALRQPAPSLRKLEVTRCWLVACFRNAAERRSKPRVTYAEAKAVIEAHDAFVKRLRSLQGRRDAPPMLPGAGATPKGEEPEQTDWEWWWNPFLFESEGGRPVKFDRQLLAEVLAAYECLTGRPASFSKELGPTFRFLDAAFVTFQDQVSSELKLPEFEALKKAATRQSGLPILLAKKKLKRALSAEGGQSLPK